MHEANLKTALPTLTAKADLHASLGARRATIRNAEPVRTVDRALKDTVLLIAIAKIYLVRQLDAMERYYNAEDNFNVPNTAHTAIVAHMKATASV
jgi:hypothetical protein